MLQRDRGQDKGQRQEIEESGEGKGTKEKREKGQGRGGRGICPKGKGAKDHLCIEVTDMAHRKKR